MRTEVKTNMKWVPNRRRPKRSRAIALYCKMRQGGAGNNSRRLCFGYDVCLDARMWSRPVKKVPAPSRRRLLLLLFLTFAQGREEGDDDGGDISPTKPVTDDEGQRPEGEEDGGGTEDGSSGSSSSGSGSGELPKPYQPITTDLAWQGAGAFQLPVRFLRKTTKNYIVQL